MQFLLEESPSNDPSADTRKFAVRNITDLVELYDGKVDLDAIKAWEEKVFKEGVRNQGYWDYMHSKIKLLKNKLKEDFPDKLALREAQAALQCAQDAYPTVTLAQMIHLYNNPNGAIVIITDTKDGDQYDWTKATTTEFAPTVERMRELAVNRTAWNCKVMGWTETYYHNGD